MLTFKVNLLTLCVIGVIDYVKYKIPNEILVLWLIANTITIIINSTTAFKTIMLSAFAFFLVAGSIIPLSFIVKCSAGDFKLFGTLAAVLGLENSLKVIFISSIISIFPLASGIKKIQLGFCTFIGYIAFLLLRGLNIL